MNKPLTLALLLALLSGLLLAGAALAQTSATYGLSWHIAGNGGGEMESTTYLMQGTIGQALVRQTGSDQYALTGGYWHPAPGSVGWDYTVSLPLLMKSAP